MPLRSLEQTKGQAVMAEPEKRYLGDSVYATFDGYHVVLTTENGLHSDPSNTIALEPQVLDALNQYTEHVKGFYERANTGTD